MNKLLPAGPAVRSALLTALACLHMTGAQAGEAAYPSRPVHLVVSFAPAGGVDALARAIAPKLSAQMGQTWVVDNIAGAGGNLGAERVASAAADGHTVLIGVDSQLTVSPTLYKLPYDTEKDLQPVTLLASAEYMIVVHPKVAANTIQELIALAKQKPGVLNYASGGVGTPIQLAAELLKRRTSINLVEIPYKGGGPAALAALAGEVDVLVGTVASTSAQVQAGKLRALATTGLARSKQTPDLPTVAESGYPGFEATLWIGLFVPGPTPRAIADRIRTEAIKALQDPQVLTAMSRQGQDPKTSTPAELASRIKTETAVWADVIKAANIRVN